MATTYTCPHCGTESVAAPTPNGQDFCPRCGLPTSLPTPAEQERAWAHSLAPVACDREEPHGEVGQILKDWAGERGIKIRFRR